MQQCNGGEAFDIGGCGTGSYNLPPKGWSLIALFIRQWTIHKNFIGQFLPFPLPHPRASGETTLLGEPRPGPYGRHAAYALNQEAGASSPPGTTLAGAGAAKKKGEAEQELSIFSLYNNPLGYLLIGMAVFGIISQNLPKWL